MKFSLKDFPSKCDQIILKTITSSLVEYMFSVKLKKNFWFIVWECCITLISGKSNETGQFFGENCVGSDYCLWK